MPTIASHGRRGYRQGCRCDQCRLAEREYQQDLKRRKADADPEPGNAGLALLHGRFGAEKPVGPRVAAFRRAMESLNGDRVPDLVAAAEALCEVLDDPKALSSRPAAAAKFADLMSQIRKSGDEKRSRLATVRSMTSGNAKTG